MGTKKGQRRKTARRAYIYDRTEAERSVRDARYRRKTRYRLEKEFPMAGLFYQLRRLFRMFD